MRVLAAFWRVGLRTLQDLSVVGFDDHAMAETFGLTTMAQPVAELGRQAAELSLALAAGEAPRRRVITCRPTWSSAPPRVVPADQAWIGLQDAPAGSGRR